MISLSEEEKGDSENYPSSTSVDRDGEFLKQHDKLAVVSKYCVYIQLISHANCPFRPHLPHLHFRSHFV